jgi:hypothetical protein
MLTILYSWVSGMDTLYHPPILYVANLVSHPSSQRPEGVLLHQRSIFSKKCIVLFRLPRVKTNSPGSEPPESRQRSAKCYANSSYSRERISFWVLHFNNVRHDYLPFQPPMECRCSTNSHSHQFLQNTGIASSLGRLFVNLPPK